MGTKSPNSKDVMIPDECSHQEVQRQNLDTGPVWGCADCGREFIARVYTMSKSERKKVLTRFSKQLDKGLPPAWS